MIARNSRRRLGGLLLAAGVVVAALATSAVGSPGAQPSRAQLIAGVPTLDRVEYQNYQDSVLPSAYAHFTPPAKPWKFCFSDAYEGNPWRVRARHVAERMVSNWQRMDLAKGSLFTAVPANSDVPTQINQIRSMINSGCNAIVAYLASTKGFAGVIQQAYQKHIVFVSMDGDPGSPYAENTGSNNFTLGAQLAQAVVKKLGGKGNVVMQDGIAGSPVTTAENAGARAVFSKNSGIHVIAEVNGDWTPSVGKTSMLNVLATHPQPIDGVWATGLTSAAIGDAFAQTHRPFPKIVEGSASGFELGWWHEHFGQIDEVHAAILPEAEIHLGFRVAMRILSGQRPKINTILQNVPLVAKSQFGKWWKPCMTSSATTTYPVAPTDPQPESVLDQFFSNGHGTPGYSYKKLSLNPCGG